MTLYEEIVNSLLNESVIPEKINDAIDKTYEVQINYSSGDKGQAKGKRVIQPVAYGLSKAGNPVIRAFQPYGDTVTKAPAWKFFRVDRILSWRPLRKRVFKTAPPKGWEKEGVFNKDGDKTMSTVYNIAVFGDRTDIKKTGPITMRYLNKNGKDLIKTLDNIDKKQHIDNKIATTGPVTNGDINQTQKDIDSRWAQFNKKEFVPKSVLDNWRKENGMEPEPDKEINSTGPITNDDIYRTQTEKDIESRWKQFNKKEFVPKSVLDNWRKERGLKIEPEPDKVGSSTGPITNDDIYRTQTEKDIDSRRKQFNKKEFVPKSVLDNWEREQEKRRKNREKYANFSRKSRTSPK